MSFTQAISSKKFFIFNLVLIGAIFGFSLAFLSFSCSTLAGRSLAQAQESPTVVIPSDALAVAENLQTAFNAVADKILPSVVEVKTVMIQRQQPSQGFNGIPWEFFFGPQQGGDNQNPGQERRSMGLGSGIVIRYTNGTYYVLTNNHVVEDANDITVAFMNGKEYTAELVGKDSRRDLAVVSFKSNDIIPIAVLGNSDDVRVGNWAIAIGNPLGEQFSFSVTMGIVSAVGRQGGPGGNINDFIQTDAPINQGNSGGPLVNIRGEVIGINTWIASNSGAGSVGLGFAIPINNTMRTIDELIRSGSISDGWLGVSLVDPERETLQAMGLEGKRGAFVSQVFLDGPAYKAGIRAGDFIAAVDKREIRNSSFLTQSVGNIRPGDTAVFTVIRGGASMDFTVKIETRTDAVAADSKNLWPGIIVTGLTDSMRTSLNLDKDAQGLYVTNVLDETPAKIIGMQRGDRITAINGIAVKDIPSFYNVLRENTDKELKFSFIRGTTALDSLTFKR